MTLSLSPSLIMASFLTVSSALPLMAADASLPLRKGGQWEMKTIMDEGGAGPRPEHTLQMCIDDAMEASTVEASKREHEANCTSYTVTAESGMTVMEADCMFGRQVVQSRTEMSGDFSKEFTILIKSTSVESGNNKSKPVKRTITQTGKFVADKCQDGLKPGEAIGADGAKMLVQ